MPLAKTKADARTKLLDAAMIIIRQKGYTATSVDDLCQAAGVTKGAFFHHFRSKTDLGVAVADHWTRTTAELFAAAPYHAHSDPLDRVLGYIDFRGAILKGRVPDFTCLVGTMVQETFESSPEIRNACNASITKHAATLEQDIAEAIDLYGIKGNCTAGSLALHTQAVLQGAFILAKADGGPRRASESIEHLRRYVEMLFNRRNK